jgi:hypothetical protein
LSQAEMSFWLRLKEQLRITEKRRELQSWREYCFAVIVCSFFIFILNLNIYKPIVYFGFRNIVILCSKLTIFIFLHFVTNVCHF